MKKLLLALSILLLITISSNAQTTQQDNKKVATETKMKCKGPHTGCTMMSDSSKCKGMKSDTTACKKKCSGMKTGMKDCDKTKCDKMSKK